MHYKKSNGQNNKGAQSFIIIVDHDLLHQETRVSSLKVIKDKLKCLAYDRPMWDVCFTCAHFSIDSNFCTSVIYIFPKQKIGVICKCAHEAWLEKPARLSTNTETVAMLSTYIRQYDMCSSSKSLSMIHHTSSHYNHHRPILWFYWMISNVTPWRWGRFCWFWPLA